MSTYQAVARAFADYPYPFNIGIAGLQLAAGIAQVKKIVSTKPKGNSASSGGGVSASASPTRTNSSPRPPSSNSSAMGKESSNMRQSVVIVNKLDDSGLNSYVEKGGIERRKRETQFVSDI